MASQYPKQINTLGDHIRARRLDLTLLQRQVADQIGVHALTIINWESNESPPETRFIPAIVQFLGYDPLPPGSSLPERLAARRRVLGLSNRGMAARMGVDQSTLRGWEARLHQPTGKSLDVIVSALENWYQVDAVGSCQFSEQSIQGKPSSSMLDCRAPTSQFPPVRVPRFMAGHCLRSN
jgi:transcriptional regulator with XRE-family HTH domain